MSMFNDIDWTRKEMMEFVLRIQEKSRSTRKYSRKDTERSSVLEMKRSGMELFFVHLKENEILQPLKNGGTIRRYRSSSIQEYQCSESWNSENP